MSSLLQVLLITLLLAVAIGGSVRGRTIETMQTGYIMVPPGQPGLFVPPNDFKRH